jgi:nucleoside-specific outer membrane channel protein Tsx
LSKLSGRSFAAGPIRDVGLTAGINAGNKNSQLHPKPRVYLAGVTVGFAVAQGFLKVDALSYQDHSCSAGTPRCPDYRGTYQVTPSWNLPFSIGSVDAEFTGFIDYIGSRGAGTVRQTLSQPQLRVDVGKYFGHRGSVYAGVEYQYWTNKFGVRDVNERHPQLLLVWKL